MISDTRYLFASLLKVLNVKLVCDIGSRDGRESLLFRRKHLQARVLAFEANPGNYSNMIRNKSIVKSGIQVFPYAITNFDGKATFNIYDDPTKGTSSLFSVAGKKVQEQVEVEAHRLDRFLTGWERDIAGAAFWIDVEGAGYEVLDGMRGISDQVLLINMEVETEPIRIGQKTKKDIAELMVSLGFIKLAQGFDESRKKFGDILFVKKDAYERNRTQLTLLKYKSCLYFIWRSFLTKMYRRVGAGKWEKMKRLFSSSKRNPFAV